MAKDINIIVAIDHDNGIGKDGTIPWKIPEDIKRFRDLTSTTSDSTKQNAVIMGRKTWESIPERFRPLPARRNIVLSSRDTDFLGATRAESFLGAIDIAELDDAIESIFVIGGAEVYRNAMPYARNLYVTHVSGSYDCDVRFPAITEEFKCSDTDPVLFTPTTWFWYESYRRKS